MWRTLSAEAGGTGRSAGLSDSARTEALRRQAPEHERHHDEQQRGDPERGVCAEQIGGDGGAPLYRYDVIGPDPDGLYPIGAHLWTWLRIDTGRA